MQVGISLLEASNEFKVGKHKIGWINSQFLSTFGGQKFESRQMPNFQKLPRHMNDVAIESELKPGMCELGDILAFLDNAPDECKDGNWNLFYTPSFVVCVHWGAGLGEWHVRAWRRDDDEWDAGRRVFSPATDRSSSMSSSSESLTLESAIKTIKAAGYKIFREI